MSGPDVVLVWGNHFRYCTHQAAIYYVIRHVFLCFTAVLLGGWNVCVTGVLHRYTRWIGGLSHQSSDLSCLHNLLQKVVIHALLDTRFKGMQVVNYPTNYQTTKVMLTKGFPKRSGYMHMNKQGTQFIQDILVLHERHWYSWSRGSVT